MKYLILLLFPTLLLAGFTEFPSVNPPDDSITAKGNLLTKSTVQTNFDACPDGEFLVWDSAQDTGMICSGTNIGLSGGNIIINGGLFSASNHINYATSVNQAAALFFYRDGGSSHTGYLSHGSDGALRLLNKENKEIYFYTNNLLRVAIGANGQMYINETGGNGGNVLHGCVRTIVSCNPATSCFNYCAAGKILTGGGCSTYSGGYIKHNRPISTTGWGCTHTVSGNMSAVALCCNY